VTETAENKVKAEDPTEIGGKSKGEGVKAEAAELTLKVAVKIAEIAGPGRDCTGTLQLEWCAVVI
jgi:hypothetical protein